jgi:hypothetical protein
MRDQQPASKRSWRGARFPIASVVAAAGMVAAASVGSAATWTQQREFTSSVPDFGGPVALSGDGNTALVGATGAVFVYFRSGTAWTLQQKLAVAGAGGQDSGQSVAMNGDGNTALIAAAGQNPGTVYVFQRTGSTWSLQQTLTVPGAGNSIFQTVALSSNGSTALISGSAGVTAFGRSGTTWTQHQVLSGVGGYVAISRDGSTAVAEGNSGPVVFHWSGTAWTQQQILTDRNAAADGGSCCTSVALSANGSVAFLGGAPQGSYGAAFLFTRTGTKWTQQQTMSAAGEGDGESATVALSADGAVAMVAVLGPEDAFGTVSAFQCSATHCLHVQAIAVKSQPNGYGNGFGGSVSLSSDGATALIGTGYSSDPIDAAWVFTS